MGFKLNLDVNDTDLRKFVKEQIKAAIAGISRDEIKALFDEQVKKNIADFPNTITGIIKEVIRSALVYSRYINSSSYSTASGEKLDKEIKETIKNIVNPRIEEIIDKASFEKEIRSTIKEIVETETKKLVKERVDKLMDMTKK